MDGDILRQKIINVPLIIQYQPVNPGVVLDSSGSIQWGSIHWGYVKLGGRDYETNNQNYPEIRDEDKEGNQPRKFFDLPNSQQPLKQVMLNLWELQKWMGKKNTHNFSKFHPVI